MTNDNDDVLNESQEVGLEFLRAEIGTGLTFAGMAVAADDDPEKRNRNRVNAEKAHEALLKFSSMLTMTDDETLEIHAGIEQLRSAIVSIPA